MTFLKTLALTALITIPASGFALAQDSKPTMEQCSGWFTKLDANKDGTVSGDETKTLTVTAANAGTESGSDKSTMIWTKAQFEEECQKGTYGSPSM